MRSDSFTRVKVLRMVHKRKYKGITMGSSGLLFVRLA